MASSSRVLTDHDEIREWADERGAKPACVQRTGKGEIGMIRLEFPGAPNANDANLDEIGWEDFFGKFDESQLALLVQDELASGGKSNFNKLIGRETADAAASGEKTSRSAKKGQGIAKGRGGSSPTKKSASNRSGGSRAAKKSSGSKSSEKKSSGSKSSAKKSGGSAKKSGGAIRGSASKKSAAKKSTSGKSAPKKASAKSGAKKSGGSAAKKSAAKKKMSHAGGRMQVKGVAAKKRGRG